MQEEFLGEESLGEKYVQEAFLGEKYVQEGFLGKVRWEGVCVKEDGGLAHNARFEGVDRAAVTKKKYMQEEFLGEKPVQEEFLGQNYVQEEFLGDEARGEKYMGAKCKASARRVSG